MADDQPHSKGIRFISTSRKELIDLGSDVARPFGFGIREAQEGLIPAASKPLPQFGPKVYELIKDYNGNAFRCNIYITKNKVYILVPYMKKSKTGKEIPKEIVKLTEERLVVAKELEKHE